MSVTAAKLTQNLGNYILLSAKEDLNIEIMMKELMNNPYAWSFLSLCTIISFVFAIYTWAAGKKIKEISVDYSYNSIIKKVDLRDPRLKITFDGAEIRNLTLALIYIWNSGNDTIYADDIIKTKLLELTSREGDILDAKIIRQNSNENLFSICKLTNNEVWISFEYLESGDGMVVQVLCVNNSWWGVVGGIPILVSKIKDGKPIRYCDFIRINKEKRKLFRNCIKVFLSLFICTGNFFILKFLLRANEITYKGSLIFISIISICFTILILFLAQKIKKKLRKKFHRDIPETLKKNS